MTLETRRIQVREWIITQDRRTRSGVRIGLGAAAELTRDLARLAVAPSSILALAWSVLAVMRIARGSWWLAFVGLAVFLVWALRVVPRARLAWARHRYPSGRRWDDDPRPGDTETPLGRWERMHGGRR